MESKKINQLATAVSPSTSDLAIIGDPVTGVSKKITWLQVSTLIGTAANLQQVTDNGATTTNPIAIGGLTITGLSTGVLKSDSGVISSVPFGAANGVATLAGDGKVPSNQLPSYVDDVVEVANYAALPATGETGKIYITLDNNKVYRWSGSIYVEIAANQAVWGSITGTLANQTDLQNALNAKVPTSRTITINGTSYDLSANRTWSVGTLTSVGLTMPSGFSVASSPLTGAGGTIAVTGAGASTQYIDGTGALQTFPTLLSSDNLVKLVRNQSGATMTAGTIVYISGATGNKPLIAKALATGDATSAQTYGLLQTDIANNADGYVVVVGNVGSLDTSALTEGQQLYLSGTTAGAYTTTKPYAPTHLVYVGIVLRSHPVSGIIGVKIQNGYELDELHDVSAQSPANNDGIFFNTSTSLWEKKSIATALGFTPISLASLSATSPLIYNNGTGAFSIQVATSAQNGYLASGDWSIFNNKQDALGGTGFVKISGSTISYDNSTYYLASNPSGYITLASLSAGAGISYSNTTGVISSTITQYTDALARAAISSSATGLTYTSATGVFSLTAGYAIPTTAKQAEWDTAYSNRITSLTTTGSSGAATLVSNTLNVPTYTLSGLGGQPLDADLTAIAALAGTSGFLKKTAADTWALDTNTYLTGNQTITLSGDVSGSGATAITTTIGALKVTNAMLAGSIDLTTKVIGLLPDANISSAATWNAKQAAITLTTTGTSGASTFISNTINIPTYSLSGLGGVPTSRTLTINGTAYDLSADRSWTITAGVTGSGTASQVPKWNTAGTGLIDSYIRDAAGTATTIIKDGSAITAALLSISPITGTNASILNIDNSGAGSFYIGRQNSAGASSLIGSLGAYDSVIGHTGSQTLNLVTSSLSRITILGTGEIGLGCIPSTSYSLDIQNLSSVSNNVLARIKNTTTNEDAGLVISGKVSATQYDYIIGINTIINEANLTFSTSSAAGYKWFTSSTAKMYLDDNATLFLNCITDPNITDASSVVKLVINGDQHFSRQGAKIYFGDATNTNPLSIGEGLQTQSGTDADFMSIYHRGKLVILGDNNSAANYATKVGIGKTAPAYTLDISKDDTTYNRIVSYWSGPFKSGWLFSDLNGGIVYDAGIDTLTLFANFATSGNVEIQTKGTTKLYINGIGLATFTSTSGSGITITTNDVVTLKMNSSAGVTKNWGFATTNIVASDFGIYQSNSLGGDPITAGAAKLYFTATGAAKFSNSVNIINANVDPDIALNVSAPSGVGKFIMFGRNSADAAVYSLSSAGAISALSLALTSSINFSSAAEGYIYNFGRIGGTNKGCLIYNNGTGANMFFGEIATNIYGIGNGGTIPQISGTSLISYDLSSLRVGINKNSPASSLDVNGDLLVNWQPSFSSSGRIAANLNNTFSAPTSSTWSNGAVFVASNNYQAITFSGANTIASGAVVAANISINNLSFSSATTTTISQAGGGIRAIAGYQMLMQTGGSANGTISHGASLFVQGVYPTTGANITFSNYYGLLINNLSEWGGVTFGSRYGIYQAGSNDSNYFAGATTFNGNVTINGSLTASSEYFSTYIQSISTPNGGTQSCRYITDKYGTWVLVGRFAADASTSIQNTWVSVRGLSTSTSQSATTEFSADFGDAYPSEVRIMGATDFNNWRTTRTIDFIYKVPSSRQWKHFFNGGNTDGNYLCSTLPRYGFTAAGTYDGFGRWTNPSQTEIGMADGTYNNASTLYTTPWAVPLSTFNWNTTQDAKLTAIHTGVYSGQDSVETTGFGVDDNTQGFFDTYGNVVSDMNGGRPFSSAVWILIKI